MSTQQTLSFQTRSEVLARLLSKHLAAELRDIVSSDVSDDITSLVLCAPVVRSGTPELTSDIPTHNVLMGLAALDYPPDAIAAAIENGARNGGEIRSIAQPVVRMALESKDVVAPKKYCSRLQRRA